MAEAMRVSIGTTAICGDGECGKVTRVVVDPVMRSVTHIVVEPQRRQGLGRLVPLGLVENTTDATTLRCTREQFDRLPVAEETQFLPVSIDYENYSTGQVLFHPLYASGAGDLGADLSGLGLGNLTEPIILDALPPGEVAVRRNENVHATDGDIGRVQGLVIDRRDHRVTHVLLQEGHLWGKKEVAIPMSAVVSVEDGVCLNMSKEEIANLPPVDLEQLIN